MFQSQEPFCNTRHLLSGDVFQRVRNSSLSVLLPTNRGPQSPPRQRKPPTTLVLCFQKRQNTDVDEPPVHLGGGEQ